MGFQPFSKSYQLNLFLYLAYYVRLQKKTNFVILKTTNVFLSFGEPPGKLRIAVVN